jgi:hypothetical protein
MNIDGSVEVGGGIPATTRIDLKSGAIVNAAVDGGIGI